MVLFLICSANTAAVTGMVSVPWVMIILSSFAAVQASAIFFLSASVMSKLSIIIKVVISSSSFDLPLVSISCKCVSLKNNSPFSSLYSLSNVPPVTIIFIAIAVILNVKLRFLQVYLYKNRTLGPVVCREWLILCFCG